MPIGKHYQDRKKNVINIFNVYKEKRTCNDGVNITFLESRVEALRNGKFTLAVAGEVKAGKSTFINALLGAEILPTDVLQASSAIVEIYKSENSVLKVKFADGKEEIVVDNLTTPSIKKAKDRLHEICRLHDKYRDIPTTLIDERIVASDQVLSVDDKFIVHLEEASKESLKDKQEKIKSYISERTKDKIPVKISFGYPLKWDFNELQVVDTPGVNATGGVQDVAHSYFEKANAILFVHPIKPIESESFKKLVTSVISDRSRETLFLILTHAGMYSNDEVERLHAEAKRLYKNLIPENRILVVDSLLKLIHCDLDNGVSVKEIRESDNKKIILSSYREQAVDEGKELTDVVLKGSRFDEMLAAIDEFSTKAPSLQLQEILEKIKEGYETQEELINENTTIFEKKKSNPQKFEQEIKRIQDALNKYKLLINETTEELTSNYSGNSSWQKDIEALKDKYADLIMDSDSIESVRKNIVDAMNTIEDRANYFSRELTQRIREALKQVGRSLKEEHKISIPKVDLEAIEEKSKEVSFKEEGIYEAYYERHWYTLWLKKHKESRQVGTKKVFDNKKFLDTCKADSRIGFHEIINDLPEKFEAVLETYLKLFREQMRLAIKERQQALEDEKNKKRTNEEIINKIKELVTEKDNIKPEIQMCDEVLRDIQ